LNYQEQYMIILKQKKGNYNVAIKEYIEIELKTKNYKYNYDTEVHNCSFHIISKQNDKLIVKFIPDNFDSREFKNAKWFFSIWLKYDGKDINKSEIEELKANIRKNEEFIDVNKKNINSEVITINIKNELYREHFNQYNEFYYLREKINNDKYNEQNIAVILDIILIIDKIKIKNINFKDFSDFDKKKSF